MRIASTPPHGFGPPSPKYARCSSTVSMCGVIRVARAIASYWLALVAQHVEQLAEPLDAAGHAARIGHAGLHEQLLLEHHHFADVHAQRRPGAFRAVDRLINHVRRVRAVLGHQQHAVLANLAQADRAHQQPADEAAFRVQAILGLLVDVRGVDHVRVQHELVAHRGQQPGRRRGVARVTADGAVDARRDQHHRVERVGPSQPALPVVEHVDVGVVRADDLGFNRFDFALMPAAALAGHDHAQRRRIGAEGRLGGVAEVRQRRRSIEQLTNGKLLGRNFHPMRSS